MRLLLLVLLQCSFVAVSLAATTYYSCTGPFPSSWSCAGNFISTGVCAAWFVNPCPTSADLFPGDSIRIATVVSTNCNGAVGAQYCYVNGVNKTVSFDNTVTLSGTQGKRGDIIYSVAEGDPSYSYLRVDCLLCCGNQQGTSSDCSKGVASVPLSDGNLLSSSNGVRVWGMTPQIYNVTVTPFSGIAIVGTTVNVTFYSSGRNLVTNYCFVNGKSFGSSVIQLDAWTYRVMYSPVANDNDFDPGALAVNCSFFYGQKNMTFSANRTTDGNTLSGWFAVPTFLSNPVISPSSGWAKIGDTVNVTFPMNGPGFLPNTCVLNGIELKTTWSMPVYKTYMISYTIPAGGNDVAAGLSTISCTVTDPITGLSVSTNLLDSNSLAIDANAPVLITTMVPVGGTVSTYSFVNFTFTSTLGESTLQMTSCLINNRNVTSTLVNRNDGTYTVYYQVQPTDVLWSTGTMTVNCKFLDLAGNSYTVSSLPANTLSGTITCSAGYRTTGMFYCQICAAGSYSSVSNSPTCTNCSLGTYNIADGLSSCTNCLGGTYQDQSGQGSCKNCPSGTYSSATAATSAATCQQCPFGYYQPLPAQSACLPCAAGNYSDVLGASLCSKCPAGTFSTVVAATSSSVCSVCSKGYYSTTAGATSCTPCPQGYYNNVTAAGFCYPCPAGTYGTQNASTSVADCQECSCNTYAPEGSSACTYCGFGYYAARRSGSCSVCNMSLVSEHEGIVLQNGYFNLGVDQYWTGNGYVQDSYGGHSLFGSRTGYVPKIVNDGTLSAYLSQRVQIKQNATYSLIVKAFSKAANMSSAPSSAKYAISVNVTYVDSSMSSFIQPFSIGTHDWEYQVVRIAYVKPIDYIDIRLQLLNLVGTVWFDDVSVDIPEYTACLCAPGEYYTRVYNSCQPCATGFSCCYSQLTQCVGTQMSFGSAESCMDCLNGWVCADGQGHPCNRVNTTAVTYALNNTCVTCPTGAACKDGKVTVCKAGTAPSADRTECLPCIPGTYSLGGVDTCSTCTTMLSTNYTSVFMRDHCILSPYLGFT